MAGLFAYHPDETIQATSAPPVAASPLGIAAFDSRFRRLLSCDHRDEICERLRPVVFAAKAKGVPVNYEELFVDLWYWGDKVKTRWAREYWGAPEGEKRNRRLRRRPRHDLPHPSHTRFRQRSSARLARLLRLAPGGLEGVSRP